MNEMQATVLVVDDSPDNLSLIVELLHPHYRIKVAHRGEKALRIALEQPQPDLILLDIMMPGLSGYQVCERLKSDPATHAIPVIFLTAMATVEDEEKGLQIGGADFITKPVNPPILLARVATHLQIKLAADILRNQNAFLEAEVAKRTRELTAIQDATIHALASLAETRDNTTGNHIRRTQSYVRTLAEQLKAHPRFKESLTDEAIELLYKSAPLHDIGKVGIPDRILLKPGKLTPEEFEIMKTHTTLGHDSLQAAEERLGMSVDFLKYAKEFALSHQEKWDGSGYPEGLSGEQIPVSARLMALADVYDALISERHYKAAMPHEKARAIILEGRGTHFDPDVIDAFLEREEEFCQIAERFADPPETSGDTRQHLAPNNHT